MNYSLPAAGPGARPKMQVGAGAVVLFGTLAVLYLARDILIPFAFALILTFLLTPVVALVQRLHVGRVFSVLAVLLVSVVAAGGIAWIIANQFVDVINELPLYQENIHAKIEAFHVPVSGQLGHAAASVKELVQELSSPAAPAGAKPARRQSQGKLTQPAPLAAPMAVQIVEPSSGWADLRELGGSVLAPLGRAGIVAIFTIFMLLNREDLRNRLLRLAGVGQLNLMTQALDDAANRVSRYILMQFLVNTAFGALFGFGLYLIGVPYPVLWGVVAAILRIVPYVGTMVAAILPIALSLAVFDGWLKPLLVFLLVASLELVIANFIEPWLYGSQVGISSLALLATAVFWTVLWGPAGLILSTPLTVCVVVLGRYVPQFSFLHILLGDEEVLGIEAQIYQRLLAMDHLEAQTIVDRFRKDKSLVELYDSVLIPALTMAEQDRHKGAIDAAREDFLFLSINEMIAEFSEHRTDDGLSAPDASTPRSDRRIICLPAHDRADEVTAAMLAQILEQNGMTALVFASGGSGSPTEWLEVMGAGEDVVVCISALPPYAFAPARAMCKQIRERFPKLKIIVGVWGYSGDTVKAKARFDRTQPDRLATTLAEAVRQVAELSGAGPEGAVLTAVPAADGISSIDLGGETRSKLV